MKKISTCIFSFLICGAFLVGCNTNNNPANDGIFDVNDRDGFDVRDINDNNDNNMRNNVPNRNNPLNRMNRTNDRYNTR